MILDPFLEWLKANQFASGGMLLGLGAILYRNGMGYLNKITNFVTSRLSVTIIINEKSTPSSIFVPISNWVNNLIKDKNKHTKYLGFYKERNYYSPLLEDNDFRSPIKPIIGRWTIKTSIGYAIISSEVEEIKEKTIDSSTNIRITFLSRNKQKVIDLINTLIKDFNTVTEGTSIGSLRNDMFVSYGAIPCPITSKSIVLDSNLLTSITSEIQTFINSKDYYLQKGIPYKKVILLSGPPGNGKTSLLRYLSNHLNIPLTYCEARSLKNPVDLASAFIYKKGPRILFCEDIDRQKGFVDDKNENSPVSEIDFSNPQNLLQLSIAELLNTLDGVFTPRGLILILTCNHIEKLNLALCRPGRVDNIYIIDNASQDQAYRLFLKFFPGNETLAREFSTSIPERKYSMACLQSYLLAKKLPAEAAKDLDLLETIHTTHLPTENASVA